MSTQEIHFAPGATSATVSGAVARGEQQDCWSIRGRLGQHLKIDITSPEENAVFDLSANNQNIGDQAAAGNSTFLPVTEPGSDSTRWAGEFPCNGEVLISVGPSRGGCAYDLTVSITGASI